ncbi:MAG: LamG domain-containing protein, partial [Phycisphaerae bacterium]
DTRYGRPDVGVDGQGGFVVTWNGYWNGEGVLARRFDGDGDPLSQPFQVDTEAHTSYGWPQVAVNDDGWFVIASQCGEWGQTTLVTFDPDGEPVAARPLESLYRPGVAIDDDGLFVASYVGSYPDQPVGDPYALYAQVYSVLGTEVGPRVMVTPGKAGGLDWNIYDSDVATDDGSYVVVWKDYEFREDGYHENGIYAARFDMEGDALGDEIAVGQLGSQEFYPTVSTGDDGRFAVAWQVLWGDGVLARAFQAEPPAAQEPGELLHLGGELAFEGDGDDVLAIDEADLNTNVYTLAMWLKADDPAGGTQSLLARGEDFSHDKAQWVVELNDAASPGKLQLWYEGADDRDAVFATTSNIQAGQWYHFAATRSAGGRVDVYLNGVLERSTTSSIVPASVDTPVLVGARTNSPDVVQDFYDGNLADVFVFDRPMSAYEVNRLLLATRPGEAHELVYEHPGAIELNGIDEYVQIDEAALNLTEYTIAFSFRADDPTRGTQSLIARGEDWASDKAQWVVEINDKANPGKLQLWYEDAGEDDHYFAAPATIQADTWYAAAFTRSADGTVRVYINGEPAYERLDPVSPAMVDTPVLIGARRNQPGRVQDYFDGTIEGVQIYNYAMSDRQVAEIAPPPRLELLSPLDGQVLADGQIDLSVQMDRPLTELSYSLDGGEPVSLIEPNWVYQEDPDSVVVRSLGAGSVEFEYLKPDWAVGARWQYDYSTAAGTVRVVDDLPQEAWDYDADSVALRVIYPDSTTLPVRTQWGTGIWRDWHELGPNNPGGNGDNAAALYDGNWSTGAAYHNGVRQWLTSVAGDTYVKFLEEAILWDVRLVEGTVQQTIEAGLGTHTLTISGTDTLGKTSSVAVTFTVGWAADINGDFETGTLGPWVLTDSGAVVTADLFDPAIAPAGGNYMGYITTGRNELPSDLHFVDLDGNGVPEREYSALAVQVTVPTAAIVEVDLNFLTAEITPGGGFGASDLLGVTTGSITDTDAYKLLFAIAPSDGSYSGTATPLTAADFSDEYIQDNPYGTYPTIADVSVFYGQTGFRRYSFSLEAGTHTLTFFVADSHTDGGATAMLIDNLTITLV